MIMKTIGSFEHLKINKIKAVEDANKKQEL